MMEQAPDVKADAVRFDREHHRPLAIVPTRKKQLHHILCRYPVLCPHIKGECQRGVWKAQ
jgi:hypothetical protein